MMRALAESLEPCDRRPRAGDRRRDRGRAGRQAFRRPCAAGLSLAAAGFGGLHPAGDRGNLRRPGRGRLPRAAALGARRARMPGAAPLSRYPLEIEPVAEPAAIVQLQHAMRLVFERGTARSAAGRLGGRRYAGKTGTSGDFRDSWFAGFGGDTLAVVWVGRDDNQSTGLTGASGALPIWADIMAGVGASEFLPASTEDLRRGRARVWFRPAGAGRLRGYGVRAGGAGLHLVQQAGLRTRGNAGAAGRQSNGAGNTMAEASTSRRMKPSRPTARGSASRTGMVLCAVAAAMLAGCAILPYDEPPDASVPSHLRARFPRCRCRANRAGAGAQPAPYAAAGPGTGARTTSAAELSPGGRSAARAGAARNAARQRCARRRDARARATRRRQQPLDLDRARPPADSRQASARPPRASRARPSASPIATRARVMPQRACCSRPGGR
jgi:membrane peptidoglycan carboxypeptidase